MTVDRASLATGANAATHRTGKGSGDENFPVASVLLRADARGPVLAFYAFARTADDVADSPDLAPDAKIALLDRMRATLLGDAESEPEALALRRVLDARGMSPDHALDLLAAFRQDATRRRYRDWDDLMDYCRLSAMPVGRFVLDVHGEDRALWPASDALCAALQVINHLQDCGKDKRALDRVYVPEDALAAAGIDAEALTAPATSPELRAVLRDLARRTRGLLERSAPFAAGIRDMRLSLEVAGIQALAVRLVTVLDRRDPLSEPVHLSKGEAAGRLALAASAHLFGRLWTSIGGGRGFDRRSADERRART